MTTQKKSFARRFRGFLRRIFGRPIRVFARTGQVIQVLYDVTQVQREQRRHYRKIGEIAFKLAKEGQLSNLAIQRLLVKIEENERILKRQEKQLYLYQRRGSFKDAMKSMPEEGGSIPPLPPNDSPAST